MAQPEFERFRPEREYCRDVRNLLSHKPKAAGGHAAELSETMLASLRRILRRVQSPDINLRCATRTDRALNASPEDPVFPVMQHMHACGYAHVPILKGGRAVVVFSESTVISFVADQTIRNYSMDTRPLHLAAYLPLSARTKQRFAFAS